ncbi:transposase [Flavobacterium sp. 7A]|uniref:transposase n=1 Tax=Flavobacterium sp. 7A TaxID=2940571 RepID=UPI0022263C22|nr:transposase [Flavobacterium sp. 7A]
MTLTHEQFIRHFAMHIFPKGFVKIRDYGFLSSILKNRNRICKRDNLKVLQEKLKVKLQLKVAKESKIRKCQCCKTGNLHTILLLN